MTTITRKNRRISYVVSIFPVVSGLITCLILPRPSFGIDLQLLQPEMQQYVQSQTGNSSLVQTSATGSIYGTSSANVPVPDGVRNLATSLGIAIPDVLLSNTFSISLPGFTQDLSLIASGSAVNYTYNVPYSLSFNVPTQVTAGERVYLNPTVTWGNPSLQGNQSLSYMTSQSVSADIPNDFLTALRVSLVQSPNNLNVYTYPPTVPGVPAVQIPTVTLDSNSPGPLSQFGTGSATLAGVTNNFGGTGNISTSGGTATHLGGNNIMFNAQPGTLTNAWYSAGNQFVFMGAIPGVGPFAVGAAAAGFVLDHFVDVDIQRIDSAYFALTSLPYFDVPNNVGGAFVPEVHLDYDGTVVSDFKFLLNTGFSLDGPGFDQITLFNIPLGSMDIATATSSFSGSSTFSLSSSVSVVDGSVSNLGREYAQLANPYSPSFSNSIPGYTPVTPSDLVAQIPEPEIYAMMLAGLGLMGFVARRRKKAG